MEQTTSDLDEELITKTEGLKMDGESPSEIASMKVEEPEIKLKPKDETVLAMPTKTTTRRLKLRRTLKISPIYKNRDSVDSCKQEDEIKKQKKELQEKFLEKKKECEDKLYGNIFKFFKDKNILNDKKTLEDLLEALYNFYKYNKKRDNSFTISFNNFIQLFPRDTTKEGFNFKRQHVFEQICRILLLLNYDNNYFGNNKHFYKSLEEYTDEKTDGQIVLNKRKILEDMKINDGSSAQSVDIFFKIIHDEIREQKQKELQEMPSCERVKYETQKEDKTPREKDVFILIQNKYYTTEYSKADKYDVTKIAHRASLLEKISNDSEYKIVLMVNNKQQLDAKITRNRNNDFALVSEIFGINELEEWFQSMLYDMYKATTYAHFLKLSETKDKPTLQLRFHQDLIINTSEKYLNMDNKTEQENKRKKFIWGCVPRSGKSYMIAGMIHKRNILKSENNILIILGAKTETEKQFIDMFQSYDNFKDYGIVSCKKTMKEEKAKGKSKFIFIISQEKIKVNTQRVLKEQFPVLFTKDNHIDLYFDEIHKGGSTITSQEKIIDFLINTEKVLIDLFIMVTATYARPSIAYETKVSKSSPVILNWSYIDQQNMKEITNPVVLQEFIHSRNTNIERKVIEELFKEYEGKYGVDYLHYLEEYYKKYPELVIIQPFIEMNEVEKDFNLHGNVFKLKCSAIGKTMDEITEPTMIFEDNNATMNLLKFIGNSINSESENLDPNCIYGKLHLDYGYDVINTRHSQLWFLPDKNLYVNPSECKNIRKITKAKQDETKTGYEDGDIINVKTRNNITQKRKTTVRKNKTLKKSQMDEIEIKDDLEREIEDKDELIDEDIEQDDTGLPNIEPLTRGIILNMLRMPLYRNHFCFLVVHNQKIMDYYGKNVNEKHIFGKECVKYSVSEKGSINDIIKKCELDAYRQNKSLIILTGGMLRLGVSLPCVDIALNFDSIKSVDLNYQTMFRVLTERKNKQFGYYLDFFPERSIDFLYEFNELYGEGYKKAKTIDDMVIQVQSLLYLFNYNGLSIKKSQGQSALSLYNELIQRLQLTKKKYISHSMIQGIQTFKKLLLANMNISLEKKLKDLVFNTTDTKKKTVRHTLKEGKKKDTALYSREQKDDIEDDVDDEEHTEEKENIDIDNLTDLLYTFVSILGLFSDETQYECKSLIDCIDKILNDLSLLDEFTDFCQCNQDKIDVLGCYMKRISNYTKEQYENTLKNIRDILNDDDNKNITNGLIIFFVNIKEVMGKKKNLIFDMSSKDIQDKIEEYLPVRQVEKDKYGEVFTPQSLIHEMLDKLPKSVWSNPDLKWLDPANGIGNFPMIVFERLNEGLKDVDGYKDEKKRKEHIIKNMLYMVELNEKNVGVSKKIFGKDANIYCGSFLEDGWKTGFGIDKFDVIIGNPPYNEGGIRGKTTDKIKRDIKGEARTLWNLFVEKSINILNNKNSYLCFIHPASWISLKSKTSELLLSKQIEYIRYYNVVNSLKLFKTSGEIPLTYYLLKNNNTKNNTKIYDNCVNKYIEFNIYKNNFIPTEVISIFDKIYQYTKKYGVLQPKIVNPTVLRDFSNKNIEYKYPVISVINKNIEIKYSKKYNYELGKPKLVFTNSTMGYPILDRYGSIFNNGSDKYYIIDTNIKKLKQIQNFFYTNLIFYLINITRTRQKFINNKIFEILPDITNITDNIDINDEFLIKLFKLTNEEVSCLNKYIENGEGRLTKEQINIFKRFNINNSPKSKTLKRVKSTSPLRKTSKSTSTTKSSSKSKSKTSKSGGYKKQFKRKYTIRKKK